MRTGWNMLMFLLLVCLPFAFTGCSSQLSEDEATQYEEVHEEDMDEEGDSGDGDGEDAMETASEEDE